MKTKLTIVATVIGLLCGGTLLWAQATMLGKIVVNSQGASGVPISCSGACEALLGDLTRKAWTICNESANNARFEAGTVSGTANGTAPSATVGFLIAASTCYTETVDPQPRVDVYGTVSLDTEEDYDYTLLDYWIDRALTRFGWTGTEASRNWLHRAMPALAASRNWGGQGVRR